MEPIDPDLAWAAVLQRDRAWDGRFVTGVLSTGIYCRPSCAARHPARANVRFFADGLAARAAGLRPCKRCRPDDVARDEAAVARALERVAQAEVPPVLAELASSAGYSPGHFQRIFTRAVGLSPGAYWRALRRERAGQAAISGGTVTDAVYAAGYGAPSRFYHDLDGRMGMSASAWVDGGRGVTIHYAIADSTLGPVLIAGTAEGVCRVAFGEDAGALRRRFPKAEIVPAAGAFAELVQQVVAAVEAPGAPHAIPLDVRGTAFQERVWEELRRIPPGETRSYAQIAAAVGRPMAVRAAGSANGANSVAVLIPCHRVVRSDGTAGGYAYGLDIKRELLRREGVATRR